MTAPNGSGRDRGRTLDCSALSPGTKLIMHRATEEQAQSECEWKRGKGVSSWIVGASVITLTLTKAAFSWKPFASERDRYAAQPDFAAAMIEVRTLPTMINGASKPILALFANNGA